MDSIPSAFLTPAEFKELNDFLTSENRADECMDISMVDGFFAAIAVRPDFVKPGVWMPEMWGDPEGAGFEDLEEAQRILGLVMRYYNEVIRWLREAPEEFEPVFYVRKFKRKTFEIVDEWCMGFVRGLKVANPEWRKWQRDPELRELLEPFLLFGTEEGWDRMEAEGGEEARHAERVARLRPALCELQRRWRPVEPGRPAPAGAAPLAAPRAGRNDPCPCGSGKKFKRCCGAG